MKQDYECGCGCGYDDNRLLAMAFVEKQQWDDVYDAKTGLCRGTMFPDLDKPFLGKEACGCAR